MMGRIGDNKKTRRENENNNKGKNQQKQSNNSTGAHFQFETCLESMFDDSRRKDFSFRMHYAKAVYMYIVVR